MIYRQHSKFSLLSEVIRRIKKPLCLKCVSKRLWPLLRYYPEIGLEGLNKATKTLAALEFELDTL